MARIFVPPAWPDYTLGLSQRQCVFLAGTIEMGNSPDWQADVIKAIQNYNVIVFNPRRVLPPDGEDEITKQINWELEGLDVSKTVYLHFCANTISPISLYELGLLQSRGNNTRIIIYCDKEYTRRLNVLTTTNHQAWRSPHIEVYDNYEKSIKALKNRLDMVTLRKNL